MAPPLPPQLIELLSHTPAMLPPPGVTPNFIDPPNRGSVLVVLNCIFLPLTIIAVTIRMIVKGVFVHQLGWDDYTCLLAAFTSIVHTACIFSSLDYGFGKHLWDIPALFLTDVNNVRHLTSSSIPYAAVTLFIKLSILLLYRRVFAIMAKTGRLFHYGTMFGIIIVTILHIPYFATQIYTVIYCETPEALIQNQFCSHLYALNISQSAINVATDFYIFILPLPCLLKLKLPTQRKLGVFVVFAGGFVACVVSIVRLVLMAKTLSLEDSTWNTALTMELSIVEVNVAIICACMTTLPPFFRRAKDLFETLMGKRSADEMVSVSDTLVKKESRGSSEWSISRQNSGAGKGPQQISLPLEPLPRIWAPEGERINRNVEKKGWPLKS